MTHRAWCSLGLALFLLLAATVPAGAQVIINEILAGPTLDWNGDGEADSRLDEWVEVANTGASPVDLAAYYLRDGTGDAPHLNLFGTLAPGATAVFYGSDAVAWQEAHDAGSSGLSLNNAGDTVALMIVDPADPTQYLVVDERTYLPHEGAPDRSSGVGPSGTWTLFDGLDPYGGDVPPSGTGCEPSPGLPNLCEQGTPVESATWGAVKSGFL